MTHRENYFLLYNKIFIVVFNYFKENAAILSNWCKHKCCHLHSKDFITCCLLLDRSSFEPLLDAWQTTADARWYSTTHGKLPSRIMNSSTDIPWIQTFPSIYWLIQIKQSSSVYLLNSYLKGKKFLFIKYRDFLNKCRNKLIK